MASIFHNFAKGFSLDGVVTGSTSVITTTHHDKHMESERIQFTDLSDHEILEFVNRKHFPEQEADFVVGDLFKITKTIIDHATNNSIFDNILQPTNAQNEKVIPSGVDDNFISPLCILKSIGCEMSSCKDKACSGEEISIQTRTEVIFSKLKSYPWEAKAVLALAAFALEYGDLWQLAQVYGQCNRLTKSVAILKRVPVLIKHATLEKSKEEVGELNHLIKATLQVIDCIFKVKELFTRNHTKDVPTLTTAMESIPTYVFWTITAIVACAIKVTHLTSDEEKPYHLSYIITKIQGVLEILEKQHTSCLKEIEVTKNYQKLHRDVVTCQITCRITEVITALILFKEEEKPPVIIVDCNLKEVKAETFADMVKENYVVFYISTLENISGKDISSLTEVHEGIRRNKEKCTIMWIPIVEDWTKDQFEKFQRWSLKMPWYKVQYFSSAAIRYLKEEWSYKGSAMSVVMNPQGKLHIPDALTLIRKHRRNFISYVHIKVDTLIAPIVQEVNNPALVNWSKDETKCIFFYGGTDEMLTKEFLNRVNKANVTIKKELGMSLELFSVVGNIGKAGEEPKYSETHKSFWSGIGSLSLSLSNYYKQVEYATITKEVRKLHSYKKEGGWVLVCQGSNVVASGRPSTISKVLENFDQWKQQISSKKLFGGCFRAYHEIVIADERNTTRPDCCSFDIAGNSPKDMDCPICNDPMETTFVSYNCCHPGITHN